IDNNLQNFLDKNTDKKIVVIYGPTACGKTAISIDIAKMLDTEIISTDSRQIFKYMDIGTAKINKDEMKGVKHHMIDIIEPNQAYSVGEFKVATMEIIEKLWKLGKIPILCGGTGLYIDSIIYDFSIPKVPANNELRLSLEKEAKEFGNEYVYDKLVRLDPEYAKTTHPNNLRYVIRAIEVKTMTGVAKTESIKEKNLKYNTFFVNPYDGDRQKLYDRIDKRVYIMLEQGLIEEVKKLLDMGYKGSDFGMKTIGYKEIISHLNGDISLDEAISEIQQNSRNYAKRQLTWFGKYDKFIEIQ
ncbi:tRNA (adenosine(37)-N6)-dimethylallyltransferase MiaA, partial [Candidatus Gracilibacteria bacterium]|nr:tRNA (adenosine(37)-N6)-dimethylallyltransferase MiaA [Candidatus Gracilibacteria bacterium]